MWTRSGLWQPGVDALLGKPSMRAPCRSYLPLAERTKGAGKTHWRVCDSTLPATNTARRDDLVEWHPPTEGCLAVSIGIGGNWGFEDSLADAGCDVHAFDPTWELWRSHLEHARTKPRLRWHLCARHLRRRATRARAARVLGRAALAAAPRWGGELDGNAQGRTARTRRRGCRDAVPRLNLCKMHLPNQ